MYERIAEILESGTQAEYKLEEIAKVLAEQVDDVMDALEEMKGRLANYE